MWTIHKAPRGENSTPVLLGWASDGSNQAVPIAVDPNTGDVQTNTTVTVSGNSNANLYTGQATVSNSSPIQVSSTSHALTNGIIIKAPTTNAAAVYIGASGVSSTTGDMLEPGETRGYAVSNANLPYIISAANSTDIVTFSAN